MAVWRLGFSYFALAPLLGGFLDRAILRLTPAKKSPLLQHRVREAVDVFVCDIPERCDQGGTSSVHVAHRRSEGLKLSSFGQCTTTATHQESHSTLLELLDGSMADVIAAASMAKIQEQLVIFQARLHLGLGGLSLNDFFPAC